jgi:peptide subunit release factor 1 (eRF1)
MTRIENTQPVYGVSRSDVEMKEYLPDQLLKIYEQSKSRRQIKCPRCGEAIETRPDPRPGAVRSRQFSCSRCNHSGIHVVRDEVPARPL